MSQAIFALLCIGAVVALALRHASLERWAAAAAVLTILGWAGIPFVGPVFPALWPIIIGLLIAGALAALSVPDLRSKVVTRPAYNALKKAMPTVSRTEREALEAGTVGWDAQLFSGAPDWSKLKKVPRPSLNDDERTFLDGPTQELCSRVDDWAIRQIHRDVPEETWRFLSEKGFFGMLISKEHGGLGFSAQAQSLVVGKIASRSPDISTVVMVPNSLGPGELIEKYGTQQQKDRFLPRLAKGEEIPCFGLTGPHSGSDAAAMRDIGIVAKGEHEGNEVLGIRLTWDKRYITLGPNATLLGIAFRLHCSADSRNFGR